MANNNIPVFRISYTLDSLQQFWHRKKITSEDIPVINILPFNEFERTAIAFPNAVTRAKTQKDLFPVIIGIRVMGINYIPIYCATIRIPSSDFYEYDRFLFIMCSSPIHKKKYVLNANTPFIAQKNVKKSIGGSINQCVSKYESVFNHKNNKSKIKKKKPGSR